MADLYALVRASVRPQQEVRRRLLAYIGAVWASLPEVRDEQLDGWLARIVPAVEGAQLQTAAMTDAYLAAYLAESGGGPVRPLGVPAASATTTALRGVPAEDVWRRPFVSVWTALAAGTEPRLALDAGLARATGLASTGVQLARTHTARRVLASRGDVVGYRRVLTGAEPCGLCATASTQLYKRGDLLPIHPGCSCAVAPVLGTRDPGPAPAPDGEPTVVHEHGEIGPVLARLGHAFVGPADL